VAGNSLLLGAVLGEREMLNWYVLPLGDSLSSAAELARIAIEFAELYRADALASAVVLQRLDTVHSLQCEVTVYFSPACTVLAQRFQATACSRPDPRGLSLLAGHPERGRVLVNDG
jgi:hypothetical protein